MKLEHFTIMFPHPSQKNIIPTLEERKKGINILSKVKDFEIEAIENLEKAYESDSIFFLLNFFFSLSFIIKFTFKIHS